MVGSLPFLTTIPSPVAVSDEPEEGEGEMEWNVRGVWKRRDDEGILNIAETAEEFEFDSYQEWASKTLRKDSEYGSKLKTACICDFQLISVYSGEYARTHFAHKEAGLEVTFRYDPSQDLNYTAVVRSVDEKWDERDVFHSESEEHLVEKVIRIRDENI